MRNSAKRNIDPVSYNLTASLMSEGYHSWRDLSRGTESAYQLLEAASLDFNKADQMGVAHEALKNNMDWISTGALVMSAEMRSWKTATKNKRNFRYALTEARDAGQLITGLVEGHTHIDRLRGRNGEVKKQDIGYCFEVADIMTNAYIQRSRAMMEKGFTVPSEKVILQVGDARISQGWLPTETDAKIRLQFHEAMKTLFRVASKEVVPVPKEPDGFLSWLRSVNLNTVKP